MAALATVFFVVVLSLLATRVATVALTLTGMSREAARFQARSALSGVGFTTSEAESVVSHPVRRRIVLLLMIVGSAGVVTAIASLMLSFAGATSAEAQTRLLALAAGLLAILLLSNSDRVDRWLSRAIAAALDRWTGLQARDYASLLRLSDGYGVLELGVENGDWVAGRTLADLRLRDEGVAVLGIEREDGPYLGAPDWATQVRPGDTVILYGPVDRVCEIDRRPAGAEGDRAHEEAVRQRGAAGDRAADVREPAPTGP